MRIHQSGPRRSRGVGSRPAHRYCIVLSHGEYDYSIGVGVKSLKVKSMVGFKVSLFDVLPSPFF